jgi:hypothetical protein
MLHVAVVHIIKSSFYLSYKCLMDHSASANEILDTKKYRKTKIPRSREVHFHSIRIVFVTRSAD